MSYLRSFPATLLALLFGGCVIPGHAQSSYHAHKPSPEIPYSAQSPYAAPAPAPRQAPYPDDNWVPSAMYALGENASFHTDFTLDRQMLRGLANGFYGDQDGERIIAGLRSISLHIYHYPERGMYDPAALNAVKRAYDARGWNHLVATKNHIENPDAAHTDLWVSFRNTNVEGMTILVQNPSTLDLIVINGTLNPLDLLHLRGHFGIPRFPADQFEPDRR